MLVNADAVHNKGAVIANITEEGKDGGNSVINTNSLTFEDIHDYNNSYETGFGIQTNFSWGGKTTTTDDATGNQVFLKDGNYATNDRGQVLVQSPNTNPAGFIGNAVDAVLHPAGSTTITVKNIGSEMEQETRATIGEGIITIAGQEATQEELEGLNRDIDKAQEITKDEVTGALDYEITIDHKVTEIIITNLAKAGVTITKEAAKAIEKIAENIKGVEDIAYGSDNPLIPSAAEEYKRMLVELSKGTGVDIVKLQEALESPEVAGDIMFLANFDLGRSLTENINDLGYLQTLSGDGKIDLKLLGTLQRLLADGADEYSLMARMVAELWSDLANFNSNPTKLLSGALGINITEVYAANPSLGGDLRTMANGGCNNDPNCGNFYGLRDGGDRQHSANDYYNQVGDYVIAPTSGEVEIGKTRTGLPYVNIKAIDGSSSRTLYLAPNLNNGSYVQQGDIIGTAVDITPKYNNTPQHLHLQLKNSQGKIVDPLPYIYPNRGQK